MEKGKAMVKVIVKNSKQYVYNKDSGFVKLHKSEYIIDRTGLIKEGGVIDPLKNEEVENAKKILQRLSKTPYFNKKYNAYS